MIPGADLSSSLNIYPLITKAFYSSTIDKSDETFNYGGKLEAQMSRIEQNLKHI